MIPTRQLLEMFCQALVETEGPGEPDHWEFNPPNGWSEAFGNELDMFITCKDAAGNTVTSYAGPVDLFPTGQMNNPDDHGWTDGVLFLTLTGSSPGGAGLIVIDSNTGVPVDTLFGDWT